MPELSVNRSSERLQLPTMACLLQQGQAWLHNMLWCARTLQGSQRNGPAKAD